MIKILVDKEPEKSLEEEVTAEYRAWLADEWKLESPLTTDVAALCRVLDRRAREEK